MTPSPRILEVDVTSRSKWTAFLGNLQDFSIPAAVVINSLPLKIIGSKRYRFLLAWQFDEHASNEGVTEATVLGIAVIVGRYDVAADLILGGAPLDRVNHHDHNVLDLDQSLRRQGERNFLPEEPRAGLRQLSRCAAPDASPDRS